MSSTELKTIVRILAAARKAIEEIKQAGISAAAQVVANAIMEM